jgi:hypothetical protein
VDDLSLLHGDLGFAELMHRVETHGMPRRERRALERRFRKERTTALPSPSSVFRYLSAFHDPNGAVDRQAHKAFIRRQKPAATAWRSEPASPLTSAIRYFFAFAFGAVVCELVFAAVGYGWLSGPIFDRVGMYCLVLTAAAIMLLWLWRSGCR